MEDMCALDTVATYCLPGTLTASECSCRDTDRMCGGRLMARVTGFKSTFPSPKGLLYECIRSAVYTSICLLYKFSHKADI